MMTTDDRQYLYFLLVKTSIDKYLQLERQIMDLCKYRDIFGQVGSGIHSYRLFGFAIVDVGGTVAIAILIARFFKINVYITVLFSFAVAILVHRAFCVNTTLNVMIFGKI